MFLGNGLAHFRHAAHVSTISGIMSRTDFGSPALSNKRVIAVVEACHHLKWSFRISFLCVAGPPVLIALRVCPTSNVTQSFGLVFTTAWSLYVRLVRETVCGPLDQ